MGWRGVGRGGVGWGVEGCTWFWLPAAAPGRSAAARRRFGRVRLVERGGGVSGASRAPAATDADAAAADEKEGFAD